MYLDATDALSFLSVASGDREGNGDSPVTKVAQPTGTVTLVFTDIEGSTRLLTELGDDAYRRLLAEHRSSVRAAFGRYRGYEIDVVGDACFYAFASAANAVQAAGEAIACSGTGPIRIRVGVHAGKPRPDPPDYIGLDVHRAARIMAAGHGGQVLLSDATRELIADRFPLRYLGTYRLKDIPDLERLYQLGSGDFPPLKAPHHTKLPGQASPLRCAYAARRRRPDRTPPLRAAGEAHRPIRCVSWDREVTPSSHLERRDVKDSHLRPWD
jgi:class 3 adenylate cyclase